MCDTVFTQKPLLYVHFDTHLAKQKVHVFKCPECTKLYAQKGSMMEHIKVRFPIWQKLSQLFAFMCCPSTGVPQCTWCQKRHTANSCIGLSKVPPPWPCLKFHIKHTGLFADSMRLPALLVSLLTSKTVCSQDRSQRALSQTGRVSIRHSRRHPRLGPGQHVQHHGPQVQVVGQAGELGRGGLGP